MRGKMLAVRCISKCVSKFVYSFVGLFCFVRGVTRRLVVVRGVVCSVVEVWVRVLAQTRVPLLTFPSTQATDKITLCTFIFSAYAPFTLFARLHTYLRSEQNRH